MQQQILLYNPHRILSHFQVSFSHSYPQLIPIELLVLAATLKRSVPKVRLFASDESLKEKAKNYWKREKEAWRISNKKKKLEEKGIKAEEKELQGSKES